MTDPVQGRRASRWQLQCGHDAGNVSAGQFAGGGVAVQVRQTVITPHQHSLTKHGDVMK